MDFTTPIDTSQTVASRTRTPLTDSHAGPTSTDLDLDTGADVERRSISVSVVIPAMNEEDNLPHVLPRIPSWVHEVVLVDGNSTDRTVEVATELYPSIRVVRQTGKGKGDALRAGFYAATGDIIVMLDADGSTDPTEIPAYIGALLSGADFAKGSRFLQGGGTADMEFYRRAGNWGLVGLVKVLFGGQFSDLCYGYNAFWRWTVSELDLDCDGFEIETMMNIRALRASLHVVEVPSFEAERIHGKSNLRTIPDGWRVLKTIMKEWVSLVSEGTHSSSPSQKPIALLDANKVIEEQLEAHSKVVTGSQG
jgi:glycosyltransferase involved in cell wall biosynthesis